MTTPASPDDPEATERQLDGFIERFDPEVAQRARACRAALRARMPTANELVYDNYNALAIGYAPRERTSEAVVSLAVTPRGPALYFIHGARDEVVPVTFDRWTAEDLKARGIEHTYVEVPDGKHVLREFMDPDHPTKRALREWVGARARDPHPARVVHRAIGAYHAAAYWVRVDAYEGNAAKVEARVAAKDRIEVTTQGVKKLTVFLDPTLVDAGRPVTLVVDGQTLHEGVAAPSLLAVASSYARARDAGLAYAQAVTVDVAPRDVQQLGGWLDDLLRGGRRF